VAALAKENALSHTSARVLEFDALRDLLRGYAFSPLGKEGIGQLVPSSDREWIERQQQLTAEVRRYLAGGGRFEFGELIDLTKLIDKAAIEGAALETTEVREVIGAIDRAAEWREIAFHPPQFVRALPSESSTREATGESPWPAIHELSSRIIDFTDFLRFFRKKISPDGSLDDRASPELGAIRRDIDKQKRAIQDSLRAYLRHLAGEGALQEEFVTIRGERFVIPVKTEQKRRVNGVVHGMSASGQTVFVEPLETIEQNNELVRLLEQEQAEVHRILLEMTQRIAEHGAAIATAVTTMAEVELQFAKARFAQDYNCARPVISSSALVLRDARHPLLERNLRAKGGAVVPLSAALGSTGEAGVRAEPAATGASGSERVPSSPAVLREAPHQMVITGPNTGGKTVALKTIGLLALVAQAGIPVPAEHAELPVFDAVLADIGDYQSIEQNLSTFSAHVTNIDFISRTATPQSLVLLDELGSATDPEEGAALAVAIADHFRRIGCFSVISTHHTSLKVYAANAEGALNAAVGFDEHTLQPTYELQIGVPGASAGINIAQRLGLNADIIASARSRLTTQAQEVGKFLERLHSELREIESERVTLHSREQEVAREKSRLAAEGKNEQRQKVREMERKLEELLREFEYHARENVNALQDRAQSLKLSKDAERRIAKLRREFREQFDQAVVAHTSGADVSDPQARPGLVKHVSQGDVVRLRSLGRNARVTRKLDENTFEAEAGAMKMRIARSDIAEIVQPVAAPAASPLKAARGRSGISVSVSDDQAVPPEINVIGQTVDQATSAVEKYVDRAFLAGLPRVRVVHGSGMGILRKALREFLRTHPHVASVAEPPQKEGGAGATVVELRI
jgi:DNA mismatch repair protein MutS2